METQTRLKMSKLINKYFMVLIPLILIYGYLTDSPFSDLSGFLMFCATAITAGTTMYIHSEGKRPSIKANE